MVDFGFFDVSETRSRIGIHRESSNIKIIRKMPFFMRFTRAFSVLLKFKGARIKLIIRPLLLYQEVMLSSFYYLSMI